MKMYYVLWVIVSFTSKPVHIPKNEFSLPDDGNRYMLELVDEVRESHIKAFANRDSAFAFFQRGKKNLRDTTQRIWVSPYVQSIYLDSLNLNSLKYGR